jgi:hypothetical protein
MNYKISVMNRLLLIIILFFCTKVYGQEQDLELRLKSIKNLKDSSLISEKEYEQLKAKILGLPPVESKKQEVIVNSPQDITSLNRKYKSQVVAGFIFTGFTGVMGVITYKESNRRLEVPKDSKGNIDYVVLGKKLKDQKRLVNHLVGATIFSGGLALTCFTLSEITHSKIKSRQKTVVLKLYPNAFSLTYCFN